MPLRPFIVVTLPAKGTVLGDLSDRGARVEMASTPQPRAETWQVAFDVQDVDDEHRDAARRRMRELGVHLNEDLATPARWRGSGCVPLECVAPEAMRLLWRPPLACGPAWTVMVHGIAQVRLQPRDGDNIDTFHRDVQAHLDEQGIQSDARIVALYTEPLEDHLERLARLGPAEAVTA